MARPKMAPDERRDAQVPPLRVTAAELHHVEEQAAAAGLSLSDYCRRVLLAQRVQPRRSQTDAAALLELNRIGVNLNQIARALNADRPERADLAEALAAFRLAVAPFIKREPPG